MKYLIAGPSHVARWKQRMNWKHFVKPQNMEYMYWEPAGAIFSKKMQEFIKKTASEVETIYLLVPDFRFGNNIFEKYEEFPALFIDGFISPHKNLISLESDQKLYAHAIKILQYYKKCYGDKIKFIFWCLNYREAKNIEQSKYVNDGKYHHPTWNSKILMEEFSQNTIDISFLQPRISEFTIDEQGHPSLKGYLFLHHLFRTSNPNKALNMVDNNYMALNKLLFMETREDIFLAMNHLEQENHSLQDTLNSKVEIGKENWLFLKNDSNHELTQHQGRTLLSDAQISNIQMVWTKRKAFCDKHDIFLDVLVVPNKRSVYVDYLYDTIPLAKTRVVTQFLKILTDKKLNSLYPLALMQKKAFIGEKLFDKIDTHWNGVGAYSVYQKLFNDSKIKDENLEFYKVQGSGDLGGKFDPPILSERIYFNIKTPIAVEILDNNIDNKGRIRVFVNSNKKLPTAVVYGDSFSQIFLPLLAEEFSKLTFIHNSYWDYSLLEYLNPDRVIVEMVERFIVNHPQEDTLENDVVFNMFLKYKSMNQLSRESVIKKLLNIKSQYIDIIEVDLSLSVAYLAHNNFLKSLEIIESLLHKIPTYKSLKLLQNILYLKLEKFFNVEFEDTIEEFKLLDSTNFSQIEIENYKKYSPSNSVAYFLELKLYLKNNLLDKYNTLFIKMDERNLHSSYSYYLLGNFYFSKNNHLKSVEYFSSVEFISEDVLFKLGFSLFMLKEYKKSIKSCLKSLEINANNYKIYFYLALSYMQLENFEESEKMFLQAFSLNPKDESILIQMSVFYRKINNSSKQKKLLEQALEINSKNNSALKEYGKLLFQEKLYLESREVLLLANKDNEIQGILGEIHKKLY